MPLMVVRHAHAVPRSEWDGDDSQRQLSPKGQRQAGLLVPVLRDFDPRRILSSPAMRCVETVRPLAEALGLEVEEDDRLAEGSGRAAVDLARSDTTSGAVLCSHGDVIPDILAALSAEDGLDLGALPRVQKASVWVLGARSGRFISASYISPPVAALHG